MEYSGVSVGGSPGNKGEGNGYRPQKNEEGNQENAGCQAFTDFLLQPGNPPFSLFRYSLYPICAGDF